MQARKLKKIWKRNPCAKTLEEFRIVQNYKGTLIKRAIQQAYRIKVAEVYDLKKGMWLFSQWSQNKIMLQALISIIKSETEVKTIAQKFISKFFPPPPKASDKKIQNYIYPDCIFIYHIITEYEIHTTILNAPSKKIPKSNGILNKLLCLAFEPLILYLHYIFNVCLTLGFYPSHFKNSITIVLCKPAGKQDYTQTKSYKPIALLNIIGKLLKSIITQRLSYMTETHQLLLIIHFDERKSTLTKNAVHFFLEHIVGA